MSLDDDITGSRAPVARADRAGHPPAGWAQERDRLMGTVEKLRRHNEQLRVALRHRSVLEQAKGILAARYGMTPEGAFAVLSKASQDHNLKVVQVAGSIVADVAGESTGSDAPAARDADPGAGQDGASARRAALDALAAAERENAGASPAARPRPALADASVPDRAWFEAAAARLQAAATVDELLLAAVQECRWPGGCDRGVLMLVEPDGALRLVAGHGLPGDVLSQWSRIPPAVDFPAVRVALTGEPYWAPDLPTAVKDFPIFADYRITTASFLTVALRSNGAVVGLLGLGWSESVVLDAGNRRFVVEFADAVARRLHELFGDLSAAGIGSAGADASGDAGQVPRTGLLATALNASAAPVLVLRPVLSDAGWGTEVRLDDLVIRWANDAAVADLGRTMPELVGRSLLELFPAVAGAPWWPALEAAVRVGRSSRVVALDERDDRLPGRIATVTRLWDGVCVSWSTGHGPDAP